MWPFRRKRRATGSRPQGEPQPATRPAETRPGEPTSTRTADDVLRELEAQAADGPASPAASAAARAQAAPADPTLGRFLLAEGPVTREFLDKQLAIGARRDTYLGRLLAAARAPREADLIELVAAGYTVPEVDLKQCKVQLAAARSVPREVALKYRTVAIDRVGDLLCVAFGGEPNPKAIEAVRRATGLPVKAFRCPPHHIQILLRRLYAKGQAAAKAPAARLTAAIAISEEEYQRGTHGPAARAEARWESLHATKGPVRAVRLARR